MIAEWVETPEVLALLKPLGVDFAQGHHIAQPEPFIVPADEAQHSVQNA